MATSSRHWFKMAQSCTLHAGRDRIGPGRAGWRGAAVQAAQLARHALRRPHTRLDSTPMQQVTHVPRTAGGRARGWPSTRQGAVSPRPAHPPHTCMQAACPSRAALRSPAPTPAPPASPVLVQVAHHPDACRGVRHLRHKLALPDRLQAAKPRARGALAQLLQPLPPALGAGGGRGGGGGGGRQRRQ